MRQSKELPDSIPRTKTCTFDRLQFSVLAGHGAVGFACCALHRGRNFADFGIHAGEDADAMATSFSDCG